MTAYMTDATKSVPLRVADPERIVAKRYYEEEFFRLENERGKATRVVNSGYNAPILDIGF